MLQFRVYFSDGQVQMIEAQSGEQARSMAALLAKQNGTMVRKVKLNRA